MGKGKLWNPESKSYEDADKVLRKFEIEPLDLGPKEGLALINGTQFISSLGAEAFVRGNNIIKIADMVGALSLEVLKGTPRAFDSKVCVSNFVNGNRTKLIISRYTQQGRILDRFHLPPESAVSCSRKQARGLLLVSLIIHVVQCKTLTP